MKEELKCPICGEPTFVYMGNARKDKLCKKHGQMAKVGEIVQCTDCGKWNEKDIVCDYFNCFSLGNRFCCLVECATKAL